MRFLRVQVIDDLRVKWPGVFTATIAPGFASACGNATERATGLQLNVWNDLSANRCMRFHVRTTGRTVKVFGGVTLEPLPSRGPPEDEQNRTTVRDTRVFFSLDRVLQRAKGWDAKQLPALPGSQVVQTFASSHDHGHVVIEYEITRQRVVAR